MRVQFSSVPWPIGSLGGHDRWFSKDPHPVFSAGGHCEQFWHGQKCPLFDVVHPAFPLPTMLSPILPRALKDGFGEAIVACDMPEPCSKFPSLYTGMIRTGFTRPRLPFFLTHFVGIGPFLPFPWQGTTDTEIWVRSAKNLEPTQVLPFKAWSKSENNHACLTYSHVFLPFRFILSLIHLTPSPPPPLQI